MKWYRKKRRRETEKGRERELENARFLPYRSRVSRARAFLRESRLASSSVWKRVDLSLISRWLGSTRTHELASSRQARGEEDHIFKLKDLGEVSAFLSFPMLSLSLADDFPGCYRIETSESCFAREWRLDIGRQRIGNGSTTDRQRIDNGSFRWRHAHYEIIGIGKCERSRRSEGYKSLLESY